MREEIDRALEDDEIAALLLRIDSPGGTVIASEMLYREVRRFKAKTSRPVIAQMVGAGTSGAYYVAMAADEVRAYPSTITGSIGVIIAGLNLSGLMERFGVANQTITTGPYKDTGSPLRPMRPEERAQLDGVAHDLFGSFLDVVEAGRPKLTRARIEELADGRVYSAQQALELGLIDALGDLPEAVESAKSAAGIQGGARVVVYHRPGEEPENLFWAGAPAPPTAQALDWAQLPDPAFLYLWAPNGGLPAAQ
jgi:protease-4